MDAFMDWLFGWFYDILYFLQKCICYLVDFICEIFYKLGGIQTVKIDGKEEDLLTHFMISSAVRNAFLGVLLIGVVLLVVFVIIAILKSEAAEGQNKKTKGQIMTKAGHSFLTFIVLPFIVIAGIVFTNVIMNAIHLSMNATAAGGAYTKFGGQILVTSGYDAYIGPDSIRAEIEQKFITGQLDYNNMSVVKQYYFLPDMNFFVGLLSSFVIMFLFAISTITFIQRIFDIILLYVISPVSVATIPLDDGGRFKIWKEMLVSKILGAYGIILAMNVFFLIVPQLHAIRFFDNGFKNGIVALLFTIGGAFAITKTNMVVAQLTGNNAGTQEAQQMLANIHSSVRFARTASAFTKTAASGFLMGSDYLSARKKGNTISDSAEHSVKNNKNRREAKHTKDGKTEHTPGQIATGAVRFATMPAGVVKDLMQGGVIRAGKNFIPRIKNIFSGDSLINHPHKSQGKKNNKANQTDSGGKPPEKPSGDGNKPPDKPGGTDGGSTASGDGTGSTGANSSGAGAAGGAAGGA